MVTIHSFRIDFTYLVGCGLVALILVPIFQLPPFGSLYAPLPGVIAYFVPALIAGAVLVGLNHVICNGSREKEALYAVIILLLCGVVTTLGLGLVRIGN